MSTSDFYHWIESDFLIMIGIGLIEGFFGPEWSWKSRHQFCESLSSYHGRYYIYAPKRDPYLRKNWTQNHPQEIWNELVALRKKCLQQKIQFGLGLSPFEIHDLWNANTKQALRNKIQKLEELEFDYLGLFFDDMKGSPDLADRQLEIVHFVQGVTSKKILFCPTYYSWDPILDKVFGQRSEDYLEKIGGLSGDIEIFWTGNKVIPKSISADELNEVSRILKRKPIIWENYFANDGPKQCKFLKLKPFEGRDPQALKASSGWAFNLMNQPSLSEILFAASTDVLNNQTDPIAALLKSAEKLAGPSFKEVLQKFAPILNQEGLDKADMQAKNEILQVLDKSRFSQDIFDWLNGKYIVGPECLTD